VLLTRAGLRGCPEPGDNWRATAYIASGSAAILVTGLLVTGLALLPTTAVIADDDP
jgi:hypothetical protein